MTIREATMFIGITIGCAYGIGLVIFASSMGV